MAAGPGACSRSFDDRYGMGRSAGEFRFARGGSHAHARRAGHGDFGRQGWEGGAGDLLFIPRSSRSRADIVRALRHIKPAISFRSNYAYDNILYIVAGEVV